MGGYSVSWGVPDTGPSVHRLRLDAVLSQGGRNVRLLCAPSGWGKTIAAAHFSRASGREVLWIDAFGEDFDPAHLREAIMRGCSLRSSSPFFHVSDAVTSATGESVILSLAQDAPGCLIVLDDVALDGDDARLISEFQRRAAAARSHLIVTTRSCAEVLDGVSAITVVGISDLRLTADEALELGALLGSTDDETAALRVLGKCGGHVALYSLMSGSAVQGIAPGGNPRIDAWVRRLLEQGFSEAEARALECAALIRHGLVKDLATFESPDADRRLQGLATRFPLFRVAREAAGVRFALHDSAIEALLARFDVEEPLVRQRMLQWALDLLWDRGDHRRTVELLVRAADANACVGWLTRVPGEVLESVDPAEVLRIIERVPLHTVMGLPGVVAFWARALYAAGDDAGAIAKAKAACHLAEYVRDHDTLLVARVVWTDALCRMQRFDEAAQLACSVGVEGSAAAQLAALVVQATVLMYVGRLEEARAALDRAHAAMPDSEEVTQDWLRLSHMDVVVDVLQRGDFSDLVSRLSVLLPRASRWESDGLRIRGNLGLGLVETGRLDRARAVLDRVLESGPEEVRAPHLATQGCALAAEGKLDAATRILSEGLELGYKVGLEADAAGNRIYVAMVMRAQGDLDSALAHAERAFERLCAVNYIGLRPLAALEVAASLLSLGDVAAARRWATTVVSEGFGGNDYHAMRAAMVFAECDRQEGVVDSGVSRLARLREHIISESSNWQVAMYIRAFPGLLGMFAAAIGADALPVHMLRMVLPENAEAALRTCKPWLEPSEWRRLGQRLLGETEFARMERRGGEPVCRVRLFGGLDVAMADRSIAEKDWRKRKARLLFAMLVSRRGQDVPREQVLDYLWPDFPEERARNNFYVAWSSMKSALMGSASRSATCPYLENKGGRLRIVTEAVRSDIDEFEETLSEARKADVNGEFDRALDAFARLSTVYRGDLLSGDVYDDWFAALRDRCRFDFVDAMVRAAEILLERDEPNEALVYARRAQSVDPLREDLYQVVMRCSIAAGQRNTAIDAFLQLRSRLADDLGLDPSAETMSLYQEILVMEDSPRYDDFGLR